MRSVPFRAGEDDARRELATSRTTRPSIRSRSSAEDGAAQTATTGLIYGAKVDSEVSLRTVDFPTGTSTFDEKWCLSADEVEEVVRVTAPILTDGDVQVASLHYVDPQRFGDTLTPETILASYGVRIVSRECLGVPARRPRANRRRLRRGSDSRPQRTAIARVFAGAGYESNDAMRMAVALSTVSGSDTMPAGSVLRVGVEVKGEEARVIRASIYRGARHFETVSYRRPRPVCPGPRARAASRDRRRLRQFRTGHARQGRSALRL